MKPGLRQRFADWASAPQRLAVEGDRVRRARLLTVICSVVCAAALAHVTWQWVWGNPNLAVVGGVVGILVPVVTIIILRKTGSPEIGGNVLAAGIFVSSIFIATNRGGVLAQIMLTVTAVPLFALIFAGRKSATVWLALTCAAAIGMAAYQTSGLPWPTPWALARPVPLFAAGSVLFAIALFGLILAYDYLIHHALTERAEIERARAVAEQRERDRANELQALRAGRMAHLGTLTAGIAHEINNPLNFMTLNLSHLRDKRARLSDDEQVRLVDKALEATARIRGVVDNIAFFSHFAAEDSPYAVKLSDVVEASVALVRHRLEPVADVHIDVDRVLFAWGDSGGLGQVVVNLLTNAVDAIRERGEGRGRLNVRARAVESQVTLDIEDDGVGMSDEAMARALEPFFTTKAVGQGTGLGLSLSYGILRKLGGDIRFQKREGGGTVASVTLPTPPS